MSRRTEIKIRQLVIISIAWLIVGCLISVYDHLVLLTYNSRGPSADYSFTLSLMLNVGSALIGAALGGSYLVFHVNVQYQDKPYGYTILSVGLFFIMVILLIIVVTGLIAVPMKTSQPLTDPETITAFKTFLMDSTRAKNIMIWFIVVLITQLLLQVNSKFGQAAFGNIMLGKYNTPKEESRIFMFLDLNSSTAIAERLGNEKYHALLKDFFSDITNAILDNEGEIYQYVGDEVVVSWDYETGIENNQCVRCFFDIKRQIDKNKMKYISRYGLIPSFKSGFHCGQIVAGEVGVIKREITYSGDVLNTTSRILGMCKKFHAEIILSGDLVGRLSLKNEYAIQPLGLLKLRGKETQVILNTLKPVTESVIMFAA
jgi:adenylate cyclase